MVLGRSQQSDFILDNPTISNSHCGFKRLSEHSYELSDLESTNGTRLNGVKVTDESYVLKSGDVVQLGGVELMYSDDDTKQASSHIVLNLEDEDSIGTQEALKCDNLSPFYKERDSGKTALVIKIVLGMLSVVVVVALVYLMSNLL